MVIMHDSMQYEIYSFLKLERKLLVTPLCRNKYFPLELALTQLQKLNPPWRSRCIKPRVFCEEGKAPALYVELDFKEVTSKKAALIDSYEQFRNKLGRTASISQEKGRVQSEHYKLSPFDLRDIKGLDAVFNLAKLDPSLPTFIIAECVLVYMEPDLSRMLVLWTAEKFSQSLFVIYKHIHPEDAFGQ